jgi:hypothetical protein
MTNRQRILAVIEGRPQDRVPFVQYSDLAAPNEEVWAHVGRENMGLLQWSSLHALHSPNCRIESEQIEIGGRQALRNTLLTPAGTLTEERLYEPTYNTTAAYAHYVKEPRDYHILLAYLRDVSVTMSLDGYLAADRALGDDGLPMAAVVRTPYQQLWVQWVSLSDLALHLVDEPDLMADVTGELARIERDIFEAVYRAAQTVDFRFVDIPDNITAPTIGARYFRRYCLPLYQRLAEMMADRDIKVFCHMDGDLQPLWGAIGESGLRGVDSFSPPPDNDTSVAQALALWPDMRLFINFPSSIHLAAPERIYEVALEILQQAQGTGRLQIQISENVPPGVWRTSYPQIIRAIHDFGGAVL